MEGWIHGLVAVRYSCLSENIVDAFWNGHISKLLSTLLINGAPNVGHIFNINSIVQGTKLLLFAGLRQRKNGFRVLTSFLMDYGITQSILRAYPSEASWDYSKAY